MNISAIRGYNDNYISFTRYCSGFARNFIYFLPIDLDIDKKSRYENEYYCHEPYENEKYKIENYISNYSFKAFPYILTYLKENMDKTKSKKLENLNNKINSMKRGFRVFIDNKIKEYLSKYKDSDLKPEKKETIHAEKKNITNLDAIYQIPYPSFLKDDILLFYQVLINNFKKYHTTYPEGCNFRFIGRNEIYILEYYNLECFVKKEKLIEIANKVYEDVQNYAKRLIETENYKIFFMDHCYFLNVCGALELVEKFDYYDLGLYSDLIGLLYLVHRCGEGRKKDF
jgi:hypothetical protein